MTSFAKSIYFAFYRRGTRHSVIPGFFLCCLLALAAENCGRLLPMMGAPVFAIGIGMLVRHWMGMNTTVQPGVQFTSKKVLHYAILLLGFGLPIDAVWKTGTQTFWIMISTLLTAIISGILIGRRLRIATPIIRLITAGTAICGASAISAVSSVIEAEEAEIATSLATVFLFNIAAVIIFPILGHLLQLSDHAFGVWAGTAINDTSSVIAAGYAFSQTAGHEAAIVKLTRAIMILPVSLGFYLIAKRTGHSSADNSVRSVLKGFPWFIIGFILSTLVTSTEWLSPTVCTALSSLGQFFVTCALVAVGLGTSAGILKKEGFKPVILGLCIWIIVTCSSLIFQRITGLW